MNTTTTTQWGRGVFVSAATVLASSMDSHGAVDQEQFLADIQSGDADKQLAAWKIADQQDPRVIQSLGKLLTINNMSIAKAAGQSILKIVHSVGKQADSAKRKPVTNQLLELLKQETPVIQTFALRALSLIADGDSIPAISPLITKIELWEEVVFCLERIPGNESDSALIAALSQVPDDFKPRLMAALGHRKVEGAVAAIQDFMQSSNKDLAISAVKAIARIGVKPDVDPPAFESLSSRQKNIFVDSVLRFCDIQIQKGNLDFPLDVYRSIFDPQEEEIPEHVICAAIVSASRIDKPEIVAAIVQQLGKKPYIVRDTAARTLQTMKGVNVEPVLKESAEKAEGDNQKVLLDILEKRKA